MAKTINILPAVQVNESAVTVDVEITEGGHTRTDQYAFNANDFDCNCSSSNPYVAKFIFEPGDITMILDVQGDFTTCKFNDVTKASAYALAQDVIADIGQYASAGGGGGSYTFPSNHGNTAYVSVDGNDGTGVVGNISKPFETANAAIAALSALVDGTIVILSSSGLQFITDYDRTTMPYTITINDLCSCGVTFSGSASPGVLKLKTLGSVNIDTNFLFACEDVSNIECETFRVLNSCQGDVTFIGTIKSDNFEIPSNTNNPSLTFDVIDWKNSITVNEPITYNRCNPMVWKGLVKQNGTSAPIATVLDNSTGETLVFSYEGAGLTKITSPGAKFGSATKTTLNSTPSENNGGVIFPHISYQVASASELNLECYDAVGFAIGDYLGVTVGTLIEIEIYL